MKDFEKTTNLLSQFTNIFLSKSAWLVVLKGIELPTHNKFWQFFRKECLSTIGKVHVLNTDFNLEKAYNDYCIANRASVKKAYDKKKAQKRAKQFTHRPLVIDPISGCVIPLDEYIANNIDAQNRK